MYWDVLEFVFTVRKSGVNIVRLICILKQQSPFQLIVLQLSIL